LPPFRPLLAVFEVSGAIDRVESEDEIVRRVEVEVDGGRTKVDVEAGVGSGFG
jgi:hypothetical protein